MTKKRVIAAIGFAAGAVFIRAPMAHAVVIGNWSNDTSDQWIDWATQSSYAGGATTLPSPEYTFSTPSGSMPGSDSLLLTESGFAQDLAIKLEYVTGGMADFFANNAIQFNITVPASSGGYTQIYEVALNAPTWGFTALTADPVASAEFAVGTSGAETYTVTVPYSNALAVIPSNAGYAEFILETNNGSGASDQYYFNSASLVTVPEPASIALFGVLPLFLRRRRRA
jgi:hypothetical protein